MQQDFASTMRMFRPTPHVLAFYDGRVPGMRAWSQAPNWMDDGAYVLGTCSYAILDGSDALVFDTHMSVEHAGAIRRALEAAGARSIRVVLSHWHADHVAGNAGFADCEIIANRLTAGSLIEHEQELSNGQPPIRPLVHPTTLFEHACHLNIGAVAVELRQADIHSRDGTVLVIPEARLLLAGDTLEDPITYVTEADRLERHLADLDRLAGWDIARILPNHGAPEVIAAGGYGTELIGATRRYVEALLRMIEDPATRRLTLREIVSDDLAKGIISYIPAYEDVHRRNVERVLGRAAIPQS